jgi:NADH-quinone oxidoreductase subunit L
MGNLRKKKPVTIVTFLIGALALSGVPPFSGFYSKDLILAQALEEKNYLLFGVAVLVAAMTVFYTFRLFFVVFLGKEKSKEASHAHESPLVMTLPLVALAIFAAIGGFIGITNNYGSQFGVEHASLTTMEQFAHPFHDLFPMFCGLGAAALGFFLAMALYKNADTDPLPAKLGALATWMRDKFYFDELYEKTVIRFHDVLAAVSDFINRWILEGAILGFIRGGTDLTGRALRLVQTGNLQTYAFLFVFGVAVLLYFVLVK